MNHFMYYLPVHILELCLNLVFLQKKYVEKKFNFKTTEIQLHLIK